MTPTNGIPCAGGGWEEEEVEAEELTEDDLLDEEIPSDFPEDNFPPDKLDGDGCSALFRTNWIRPAN